MNADEALAIIRRAAAASAPPRAVREQDHWLITWGREDAGSIPLGSPSWIVLDDGRFAPVYPHDDVDSVLEALRAEA